MCSSSTFIYVATLRFFTFWFRVKIKKKKKKIFSPPTPPPSPPPPEWSQVGNMSCLRDMTCIVEMRIWHVWLIQMRWFAETLCAHMLSWQPLKTGQDNTCGLTSLCTSVTCRMSCTMSSKQESHALHNIVDYCLFCHFSLILVPLP